MSMKGQVKMCYYEKQVSQNKCMVEWDRDSTHLLERITFHFDFVFSSGTSNYVAISILMNANKASVFVLNDYTVVQ
jgi:hypothetical protein